MARDRATVSKAGFCLATQIARQSRLIKKGINILDRIRVSHMAQMHLASDGELRGEKIFHGKGRCAICHPAPFFLDHQIHDLKTERFLNEPPRGPIKTFTLRGIN